MSQAIPQLSPTELDARVRRGDDLTVIDVREPWELERASVAGATSIPLGELADAAPSLDREREYVVMCHHGSRSAMAVQWLRQQGFARVSNLDGGIDAWSREIDPSIPQY
jgi:rhodanese-related sulfurtransferase